jgi:hypothetical protein
MYLHGSFQYLNPFPSTVSQRFAFCRTSDSSDNTISEKTSCSSRAALESSTSRCACLKLEQECELRVALESRVDITYILESRNGRGRTCFILQRISPRSCHSVCIFPCIFFFPSRMLRIIMPYPRTRSQISMSLSVTKYCVDTEAVYIYARH